MDSYFKFLQAGISFNAILQIGIDVIMLGLLAAIMLVKRPKISKRDEAVVASLEKIVEETTEISKKFEINLEKRQDLLKQITAKLDERIQEGRKICARLEELSKIDIERMSPVKLSAPEPDPHVTGRQKVLALAGKGMNAAEIAKRLKRPLGEVELILNLRKIAS